MLRDWSGLFFLARAFRVWALLSMVQGTTTIGSLSGWLIVPSRWGEGFVLLTKGPGPGDFVLLVVPVPAEFILIFLDLFLMACPS